MTPSKYGNELLASITGGKFLDYMIKYQLLKKNPPP
jgi:hypothetical protein